MVLGRYAQLDLTATTKTTPVFKMNIKLEAKIEYLIKNIHSLIKNFSYRQGPDLYFYRRVTELRKKYPLQKLFNNIYFIELLYATLTAWDMNARGAKMKYFDEFRENILKNRLVFEELESFKLSKISVEQYIQIKSKLEKLYEDLHVMKTGGKLVSNSKIMHFLLPDLIMPMDRQNTLRFFFGHTAESGQKFLDLVECSFRIAKRLDLSKLLDEGWNRSVPKIIDNSIICYQSSKYRKM